MDHHMAKSIVRLALEETFGFNEIGVDRVMLALLVRSGVASIPSQPTTTAPTIPTPTADAGPDIRSRCAMQSLKAANYGDQCIRDLGHLQRHRFV